MDRVGDPLPAEQTFPSRRELRQSRPPQLSRRSLLVGGALGLGGLGVALAGSALAAPTPARARLDSRVAGIVSPLNMGVAVYDRRSRTFWSYRGTLVNYLGSVVKAPTAITVSRRARSLGRAMTAEEQRLVAAAIQVSDNNAQSTLWNLTGRGAGFTATCAALGMSAASKPYSTGAWGLSVSTPIDLLKVVNHLAFETAPLDYADMRWIERVMAGTTASQSWGVGAPGRTSTRSIALKNGWVPVNGLWRVNSIGHVRDSVSKADYTCAILSTGGTTFSTASINRVGLEVFNAMALGPLA